MRERYGRMKMECKNCGSQVLEGDNFCPRCGMRVAEGALSADAAPPGPASLVKAEMEAFALPLCIPEEKPSNFKGRFKGRSAAPVPDKPRRWVSKVVLGIFGVMAVIVLANSAKLANSFHRNFSTPEEYYRWVERKTIRENAKTLSEYYVNHFVEYLHRYDSHTSGEIRVELGEAGRNRMERAGLEPWFEERAFTFESTSRDSVTQSVLGLEIGGVELFSMDVILDLRDEAVYMGFPGLTETYLGVDTEGRGFSEGFEYAMGMKPEEYLKSVELLEALYEECPDKSQVKELADRYMELLLNSIDDVRMRTGKTARAGSVAQNCTTLEICLDKDDIQNMLTEFLEELQEDSEIETLLFQIFDLAEKLDPDRGDYRDFDEFYEAFQDYIDELLGGLDYYVTYHDELDMTVYVDDKGRIIGRRIEFPNSRDEISFSYLNPHHGSRFGYKGSITADGEELLVTGSGRNFGNKVSGSFTVEYEGSRIIDVEVKDLDRSSLKKGYINGSFTLMVPSGTGYAQDRGSAYSYLTDMRLIIDVTMSRSSEKLRMELREGRELWGTLTIASKSGKSRKISVPTTRSTIFIDDDRDFEDWWDTTEWEELIKKMDKAGLPSDDINAVVEFSEMDVDEVLDKLSILRWFLMEGDLWE